MQVVSLVSVAATGVLLEAMERCGAADLSRGIDADWYAGYL